MLGQGHGMIFMILATIAATVYVGSRPTFLVYFITYNSTNTKWFTAGSFPLFLLMFYVEQVFMLLVKPVINDYFNAATEFA